MNQRSGQKLGQPGLSTVRIPELARQTLVRMGDYKERSVTSGLLTTWFHLKLRGVPGRFHLPYAISSPTDLTESRWQSSMSPEVLGLHHFFYLAGSCLSEGGGSVTGVVGLYAGGSGAWPQPSEPEGHLKESQDKLVRGASMATRAIVPESLVRDEQFVLSPSWALWGPTLMIKTCHLSFCLWT